LGVEREGSKEPSTPVSGSGLPVLTSKAVLLY
jgi:hypothetical protein